MRRSQFLFGDIVVVDDDQIGVVVKSWGPIEQPLSPSYFLHEVYVRSYNDIREYKEALIGNQIERYRVRHKELNDEEMEYQKS